MKPVIRSIVLALFFLGSFCSAEARSAAPGIPSVHDPARLGSVCIDSHGDGAKLLSVLKTVTVRSVQHQTSSPTSETIIDFRDVVGGYDDSIAALWTLQKPSTLNLHNPGKETCKVFQIQCDDAYQARLRAYRASLHGIQSFVDAQLNHLRGLVVPTGKPDLASCIYRSVEILGKRDARFFVYSGPLEQPPASLPGLSFKGVDVDFD